MKRRFLIPFVLACMSMTSCASVFDWESDIANDPTQVNLSQSNIEMKVGDTAELQAFVSEGETSVEWVCSNETVVSINPLGNKANLEGLSLGEATITAVTGKSFATCKVSVTSGSGTVITTTSLDLDQTNKTVDEGEEFVLNAIANGFPSIPTLTWTVTDDTVLSLTTQNNTSAVVKALKEGTAGIDVKATNLSAHCDVTVRAADPSIPYVRFSETLISLEVGGIHQLNATTNPAGSEISWKSSNEGVATVNVNGLINAISVGTAVISGTITVEGQEYTDSCNVSVTEQSDDSDYNAKVAAWSQPGHLYLHYLRRSDSIYDKWALWIWNSYPIDGEGTLWGANTGYDLKGVTPQTIGWMNNGQCGGVGTDPYADDYGRVVDVDLTLEGEDIPGGKTRKPAPLIEDWTDIAKTTLGFLIVDQSKMTGEDMWVSDGGAEVYIKRLGKLMPEGKDSYLHIYCVEGNVADYKTTSGKQTFVNPTIGDTTGSYRSKNDITDLKYDAYPKGVRTSETFLNDRPGVGYQIFVPSFCDSDGDGFGDLQGIISKLDYLKKLGIEVLWLTPIQESNSYHGYDVTDYYKIDPRYGTLQDYQELIYKAHKMGMKVLMDMVINHTSKSNVLYKKSQKAETEIINGKTINYRDMYLWKFKGDKVKIWDHDVNQPVSAEEKKNPTFTSIAVEQEGTDWYKDGTSDYYYFGKFGSGMAELNYSCQATRDYMTDMCKYWLSFGLDGFRLDAIKHIYLLGELDPNYNTSGDYNTYDVGIKTYYNPEMMKTISVKNDYSYDRDLNVIFWKQFAGSLKSAYPNCFLVGENFDGWNERIAPFYEAIDSQFDFSTYYHLHESTADGIVAMGGDLTMTLNYNKAYRSDHINGAFTSNHDVARFINHAASVIQTEHHTELKPDKRAEYEKRARWDGAISILTPGVSWIYYGDEIGLSGNVKDQVPDSKGDIIDDHGNNVDRWYRQPMRWGKEMGKDGVVKYQFSGMEVLWDFYNQALPTVDEQWADSNSLLNLFANLNKAKNDDRYPTYGYIVNQWAEGSNMNVLCLQISDGVRTVNAFINATDSQVAIASLNQGEYIWGSAGASGNGSTIPANGFTVVAK